MDEFTVVSKARAFIRKVNATTTRAPIKAYLEQANAKVKPDKSMGPDEAGSTFEVNGTRFISVNGNDNPERQNFTVCHELAHIILGLPSEHGSSPWWSYAGRSPNEIACPLCQ
jgi:Zn-dependent peptidase ImmA (M78 family)